jgi:hypothetical protein
MVRWAISDGRTNRNPCLKVTNTSSRISTIFSTSGTGSRDPSGQRKENGVKSPLRDRTSRRLFQKTLALTDDAHWAARLSCTCHWQGSSSLRRLQIPYYVLHSPWPFRTYAGEGMWQGWMNHRLLRRLGFFEDRGGHRKGGGVETNSSAGSWNHRRCGSEKASRGEGGQTRKSQYYRR